MALVLEYPSHFPDYRADGAPKRYLAWIARAQWKVLAVGIVLAIVRDGANALMPLALGKALDAGLESGFSSEVISWALVLMGLGMLAASFDAITHLAEVMSWMRASITNQRTVGHHVSRSGHSLTKELPTGEIISTVASDAFHVGNIMESLPRLVGGLMVYVLVSFLLLSQSVPLGLFVLIGLPVVTALTSLLVKPLQERQNQQRESQGKLTTLGSDTVAGLRILRGIGGEDVFSGRYREQSQRVRFAAVHVANVQSILMAVRTGLPALFVVGVVWFGARLAVAGDITPGQLVSFYGYTAYLSQPLRQVTFMFQLFTRAKVAENKTRKVLAVEPAAGTLADRDAWAGDLDPLPEGEAVLADRASGLELTGGAFTVLVGADPDESAAFARTLARMDDAQSSEILLAGRPITHYPLPEVRRRVVLAEATPQLFTGTLRSQVDAWESNGDDEAVLAALAVADAHDVTQTLGGLAGEITEKGRSLSGGQRQRVALARAVLTEAEIAVLIEPTSAVDAHTEARIAAQLARTRKGRTTIVVSASPLVLEHADEVVFIDDGTVIARGTHQDLLHRAREGNPDALAYRAVVARTTAEEEGDHAATNRR
nr:ABC transporter ATP-binding protein [Bowdeniella massiliensis]